MVQFVTPAEVRTYAKAKDEGRWVDAALGPTVEAGGEFLEYRTGRQFAVEAGVTKTFATEGRPTIPLPDLRSAVTVTLDGTALVVGDDYRLVADPLRSGIYVAIRLRPRGVTSYAYWQTSAEGIPWVEPYQFAGRFPNTELEIVGNWGHVPYPPELLLATKAMSAFLTWRPDALLAGVRATPDGTLFDLSRLPLEVQAFLAAWSRADRQPQRQQVFA